MELNKNNYYSQEANQEYMSVSQFKSFDIFHGGCESKALAELKGEWKDKEKSCLLQGNYIHSWAEGEEAHQQFLDQYKDQIFKSKGGKYADFELMDKVIISIKNDKLIMTIINNSQKEVIMTGNLFGIPWKIRIDLFDAERNSFTDIKTVRSITEKQWSDQAGAKVNFIEQYDYLLQAAVYAEIIKQNTGLDQYFKPHIIAVSKEEIPDKAVIYLGTEYIQDKLFEVEMKISRIDTLKKGLEEPIRCEKCDYCKSTKQAKIIHYSEL